MSASTPAWDVALRESLREEVSDVLAHDSRVARVDLNGSLASGQADIYSDVDVIAQLQPGVVDREFFFGLPELMNKVRPRVIDGWSFPALPRHYAGTFYFEGAPLFWHVDIGCRPAASEWHVDGQDLLSVSRWEQRFKMWIEAVLRLVRVENSNVSSTNSGTSTLT